MMKLLYGNTNTYFMPGDSGGLLVDTDYAGSLSAFYKALKRNGIRVSDIEYVMATHYHPDHMGLIGELMKQGVKLLLMDVQEDFVHDSDRIFARDKLPYTPIHEEHATVITCEESRDFLMQMGIAGEIIPTASHSADSVSVMLDNGDCLIGDLEPFEYIEAYGENHKLKEDWERILSFHPKRIHASHRPERITEGIMNLSDYDGKYVSVRDTDGNQFSGRARYGSFEFLECEWGLEEEGLFIEDVVICRSQIESIEETVPHGTAELWTEHLVLRRYRLDDAEQLYEWFGKNPAMYKYSGWNPYATLEMTQKTVQQFIDSYGDDRSYSWVMDVNGDDVVVGTIGAYDYDNGRIEIGISVSENWQGRGFATEALKAVLEYLTENEGIACVTAWCAAENTGSSKVMEKAGMQLVKTEKVALAIDGRVYDKWVYEYRRLTENPS